MAGREGEPRAKYLRLGERSGVGAGAPDNDRPSNDNAPAVTLTRGELAAIVRGAVADALGAREARPALLDRDALAQHLGCGVGLVDKLRRQGMPFVRLGDSPRFELERCLDWLKKEGAA